MIRDSALHAGIGKAAGMAFQKDGSLHPKAEGTVIKLLAVQRPAVTAYLRGLRRRNPEATPEEIAQIVRGHYVNLTTGGGAAVGITAVVPGLGSTAAIGVAAIETAGFLEGSALYAQAIAELHGLPVRDPERANALVMGLMLGNSGKDLVRRFAGQASGTGPAVTAHWGSLVAKQIPASTLEALTKSMRRMIIKKYAAKVSGSMIGRLLPFGVGAVIGGVVNRQMAKSVVAHTQTAFGPYPTVFEAELDPRASSPKSDATIVGGLKNLMALRKQREKESRRSRKRKGKGSAAEDWAPVVPQAPAETGRPVPSIQRGDAQVMLDPADQGGIFAEPAPLPRFEPEPEAPRTYRPDVRL